MQATYVSKVVTKLEIREMSRKLKTVGENQRKAKKFVKFSGKLKFFKEFSYVMFVHHIYAVLGDYKLNN